MTSAFRAPKHREGSDLPAEPHLVVTSLLETCAEAVGPRLGWEGLGRRWLSQEGHQAPMALNCNSAAAATRVPFAENECSCHLYEQLWPPVSSVACSPSPSSQPAMSPAPRCDMLWG